VDDAQAVYNGLVEQDFTSIALAGDSAGGGLVLVLLALLAAEASNGSGPQPVGAVVMSPWTDLALSGVTMETRADADPAIGQRGRSSTGPIANVINNNPQMHRQKGQIATRAAPPPKPDKAAEAEMKAKTTRLLPKFRTEMVNP